MNSRAVFRPALNCGGKWKSAKIPRKTHLYSNENLLELRKKLEEGKDIGNSPLPALKNLHSMINENINECISRSSYIEARNLLNLSEIVRNEVDKKTKSIQPQASPVQKPLEVCAYDQETQDQINKVSERYQILEENMKDILKQKMIEDASGFDDMSSNLKQKMEREIRELRAKRSLKRKMLIGQAKLVHKWGSVTPPYTPGQKYASIQLGAVTPDRSISEKISDAYFCW